MADNRAACAGGCTVSVPDFSGTRFRCDNGEACPSGQTCIAGSCAATGSGDTEVVLDTSSLSTAVANVPVLIRIDAASELGQAFGNRSLRLFDGDDEVPYEVEPVADDGASLVWVLVSELTPGSEKRLLIETGTATALSPSQVWVDYAAVFHFSAPTSDELFDSVSQGNGAAGTAISGDAARPGRIGGGSAACWQTNRELAISGTQPVTVSLWARADTGAASGFNRIVSIHGEPYEDEFSMGHRPDGDVSVGRMVAGSGIGVVTDDVLQTTDFVHIVGSYDGATVDVYVDGAREDTGMDTRGATITGPSTIYVGCINSLGDLVFEGTVDEVRLMADTRPPEWHDAVFRFQSDPALVAVAPAP